MFKPFLMRLPAWARPEHPVLRTILQRYQQPGQSRWRRAARVLVQVLALLVLALLGYQLATEFGTRPSPTLHAVLYWPLVVLGVGAGLAAMMITGGVVSLERARGTWDSLRTTPRGIELAFQARWLATFYGLRGPLGVLLLARGVFVLGILLDLARYYRGRYLELLLNGITPPVSVPLGAVLLAATMTAALLQPLAALGLDASVGLLVSVVARQPRHGVYVRAVLGGTRILLAVLAFVVGGQAFAMAPWMTPAKVWAGVLLQSLAGDQGLRLLDLEESGLLWVDLSYGILIGPVLLGLTLVQMWLAGRMVGWAVRLAERGE